MKEKEIVIEGSITPEMVVGLCGQLEGANLEKGDLLNVLIDSEGGYVDAGLILAECIEGLQNNGIMCKAVAGGKVWSAAMLPFLACNIRMMGSAGSFLIHKVMVPIEKDTALEMTDINLLQDEVWNNTNLIDEYYKKHNISESARSHLWRGDDLFVNNELEALAYGIITSSDIIGSPINMRWNNIFVSKKSVNKKVVCKATPYIINFKSNNNMDEKKFEEKFAEIENRLNAKLDDLSTKVLDALNRSKNEDDDTKPEPMNAEPLTEEELKQLGKHMTKTPVAIETEPDIKWLAHPGKDVEKDHFVIPISKDGKAVMLPEGDYEVKIDGESFMIHSTGVDSYLHGRGVENDGEEVEVEKKAFEVEDKKKNEKEVTETKVETKSKAPMNRKPGMNAVNVAKAYWEMARKYGKGGVGVTNLKK